jgi:phage-related protein
VPPEVSKLIAAVTTLVSALNESAGVTAPGAARAGVDDRVNDKKEKVASAPGLLVRFNEPQASDKAWGSIAKIFAKTFVEATKGPDYGDESTVAVPAIIQQTAVVQEKTQEGFFSKLIKFLLPIIALVGGIGLSIAALFQGPGVLGNALNLVGKLFATIGQNYITKIGNKLLNLGDDFIKGLANLAEGGFKLLGIGGGGSLGKMFGGIAAKVGGFLLKAAKFIPFLGAAVSFYFAYKRFQSGDYVGMGLEIASGILNLIPGFGWIASAIVDVINITRDFTTTEEERTAGGTGIFSKLFGGIKEWFKANGMTILRSLPVVGSIMYFQEAYNAGFTTPEGIKKTMIAFASILGAGPLVERAVNGLFSLFGEKEEEQTSSGATAAVGKSFFQIAKEFVIKQVSKLPFFLRKPLEWLGIIKSAESESEESWMSQGIDKSKEAGKQVLEKMSEFGSGVKGWFAASLPGAKEAGKQVLEKMSEFGSGVKDWFVASLPGAKEAGKQVLEKMSEFGSGVKDWFVASLPGAKEAGKQVLEKMSEFGSGVKNWFSEKMAEGREKGQEIIANITKSGESIFNAATEMVQNIKSSVESGIEVLKNTLTTVFSEIEETTNKIIDWVKGIFSWVSEKMGKFLSKIVNIFDPQEQSGAVSEEPQINFAEDAVINIKNPALDIIADNSKKQVDLLREMISKLDNLSLPSPSPAATPPSASPTTSSGGSINRGFGSSSLLSMETMGSLA